MQNHYEKLGAFYLGKEYDLASRTLKEDLILYDSKDLNTHAVIIGMTGSGKTGLGIGLLEEALIDNIREIRTYEVECPAGADTYAELDSLFSEHGLRVNSRRHSRSGDVATCTWETHGSPDNHARLIAKLLDHGEIKGFRA